MHLIKLALCLTLLTPSLYALDTINESDAQQTRGLFSMINKSTEILAKTRKVLKNSNDTTPSLLAQIDAIQKTVATAERSGHISEKTLATLLKCYIAIVNTAMLMTCKEFDLLDQAGTDLIATFDSTVPGQITSRYTNARTMTASLEKLSKKILDLLQK